jgi:hypothetical protein
MFCRQNLNCLSLPPDRQLEMPQNLGSHLTRKPKRHPEFFIAFIPIIRLLNHRSYIPGCHPRLSFSSLGHQSSSRSQLVSAKLSRAECISSACNVGKGNGKSPGEMLWKRKCSSHNTNAKRKRAESQIQHAQVFERRTRWLLAVSEKQ